MRAMRAKGSHDPGAKRSGTGRVALLDAARGLALLAMAAYHFVFDLELFGHLAPGTATTGGWRVLAQAIAGAFLALSGVGLWLAHGSGFVARAFLRRLARIGAAALIVTAATLVAIPPAFVFFGILHAIALCSVLGLPALRLPDWALSIAAAAVVWIAARPGWAVFDPAIFWWTGLQTVPIQSVDYVPVFPWFAPFLAGMAVAKAGSRFHAWARLARLSTPRWLGLVALPGRHRLPIYLVHQPILIGGLWVFDQVAR